MASPVESRRLSETSPDAVSAWRDVSSPASSLVSLTKEAAPTIALAVDADITNKFASRLVDRVASPSSPSPIPALISQSVAGSDLASYSGRPSLTRDHQQNHDLPPLQPIKTTQSYKYTQDHLVDRGFPSPQTQASRSIMHDRPYAERSPSPHLKHSTPPFGAMAEAMSASKSPGLIRRISRGAHNKLRRRASTTHSMRMRDPSAGPILVRRRSDSNGTSEFGGQDVSDLDLDSLPDDVLEEAASDFPAASSFRDRANGLGISIGGRPGLAWSNGNHIFEGGIAPASSAVLEAGTWLTKLTKRRAKRVKLWLDSNSARVCWHASNPTKSFFIDDVREVRVGAESRNARDDMQIPVEQEGRWVTIVYDDAERANGRTIKTMHVLMPDDYILKLWTDALDIVSRERTEIMNALASSTEKSEKSVAMAWRQAMMRKPSPSTPRSSAASSASSFLLGPAASSNASPTEERFSLDDARWLCRKLEINCSDHAVRTHFKAIAHDETRLLDYDQYREFVQSFRDRKDIQHIYRNMKFGSDLDMDLDTFLNFLRSEQLIEVHKNPSYWESVFDKFTRAPTTLSRSANVSSDLERLDADKKPARYMSMAGFQSFLTSSYNSPLQELRGETRLDFPLNEYFISSSHNTYLLGRQVAGASSVEGYIAALVKGCRCVEIDCWDGDDGRPMVTHGRTMTTKIPFEDCVSVIAKYAFNSSPYPLIISLEVHCNPEQQLAMVDLMRKYFSPMMITEPLVPGSTALPSPEELKNRILIKVKASETVLDVSGAVTDASNGRSRARSIGSAFNRASSIDHQRPFGSIYASSATSPSDNYAAASTPRGSTTSGPTMSPATSSDSDDAPLAEVQRIRKTRIVHELGKLGVYTQGIKFNGFSGSDAKTYNHVYSFAENTFDRLCVKQTENKAQLETHNLRHLMRVYPSARRLDSSNFNPLQSWRRGVQMAALNWQTYDVHQQVNEAMFAAGSDRLGYVLKPEDLRMPKSHPLMEAVAAAAADHTDRKARKGKKIVKFGVDIISAQRLPRPRNQGPESGMNPYIEFDMFFAEDKARGVATAEGVNYGDSATGNGASFQRDVNNNVTSAPNASSSAGIGSPLRKRTRVVEGNGFDPQYNQPISMAVETKYPSLIFVRWTVWHVPEQRSGSVSSKVSMGVSSRNKPSSVTSTPANRVLLATFTAKLSSLQQGYRHLPLFNPQGEQYRDAKLFVKIRKDPWLPVLNGNPSPPHAVDHVAALTSPSPGTFSALGSRRGRGIAADGVSGISASVAIASMPTAAVPSKSGDVSSPTAISTQQNVESKPQNSSFKSLPTQLNNTSTSSTVAATTTAITGTISSPTACRNLRDSSPPPPTNHKLGPGTSWPRRFFGRAS